MTRTALILCGLLAIMTTGCGQTVNITTWQQQLERYVRDDGHGDPNVLREVPLDELRRGFILVGGDDPRIATDAKALLLGHKIVGGRSWFFYLVGIVKKQKVEEIRLAGVSVQNNTFTWALGVKNAEALHLYRNYNEGLGKQRFPGRRSPPPEYSNFPRGEDEFEFSLSGNRATVLHRASGAWWELNLGA